MKKAKKVIGFILRVGIISYLGTLILLASCQRRFIYHPTTRPMENVERRATNNDLIKWESSSDTFYGWYLEPAIRASQTNTLVVFHGNAGYAIDRLYFAHGFQYHAIAPDVAWKVFLFEYPGYGGKPGKPSEKAIRQEAVSALIELNDNETDIFLLGESLGTGIASYLSSELPELVKGLVLVTPFTSLSDVAKLHYPFFPVNLCLTESYNNAKHLKSYDGPTAFIVADNDNVVSTDSGLKLFNEYTGIKRLWQLSGSHNTLNYSVTEKWWLEVISFLLQKQDIDTDEN
ncbi:MAG: alpha/beta hydrolase [Lentisphaerae bacterium]|nr:alpha/beta hydrolase [Lentisphaerota bacterium]